MTDNDPPSARPPLGEVFRTFARVGLLSFGGPAGQIALMHRVLVEEKRWLDEPRFLHALNYCMLLPGPEAMQLATYAGWLLHGTRGGLVAGLLFVLPGAAVIVLLAALYLLAGETPLVAGALFGLKAAVLALVVEALIRVGRRALGTGAAAGIALAAFLAIALGGAPFPLVVLAAALAGVCALRDEPIAAAAATGPAWPGGAAGASWRAFLVTAAAWLGVWLGPLLALWALLGRSHVLTEAGVFFATMAAVTFGGAYAVLAYVAQEAVSTYGWLSGSEMVTGLGLAETTPGPLILVLVFVGFLGAARQSGLDPLLGGLGGAGVALWFTFAPSFLFIFAGAPFVERLRGLGWLRAALAGVSAAVVGVIASLALWFALHVLFVRIGEASWGPLAVPLPELASFDWRAALIALAAGIALLRFHLGLFPVLGGAVLAGLALRQIG